MKKGLNGFQLKVIACIIMVIDHTGILFFPNAIIFRIIGRLAFPLFAFFISEGFFHTRSVSRYLKRLGFCAVLFQIPDWFSRIYSVIYNVPGFGVRYKFNIFSTLFFGLLAIVLYDWIKSKSLTISWLAVAAVAAIAEITGADYGAYGVLYIVIFYLSRGNIRNMVLGGMALHGAYVLCDITYRLITSGTMVFTNFIQLYSLLSIPLIALYNNERGIKAKYIFYIFYPAHLIILYTIDWIL